MACSASVLLGVFGCDFVTCNFQGVNSTDGLTSKHKIHGIFMSIYSALGTMKFPLKHLPHCELKISLDVTFKPFFCVCNGDVQWSE